MARSFAILIRRLMWLIIGVGLVIFAVNNRQVTEISFNPLPYAVPIPIWGVLFAGIFIGLIVSAFVTGWLRLQGFTKRRQAERRADYLDSQMAAMAEDTHKLKAEKAHKDASETALSKND